jgi:hypothetical protein
MARPAQTLNRTRNTEAGETACPTNANIELARVARAVSPAPVGRNVAQALLRVGMVLTALLLPLHAGETLFSKHQLEPGMYVWDGLTDLPGGIAALDHDGFHAIRLLLSPASRRAYALPPFRCAEGRTTLQCLVLSDAYKRALSGKALDVVMFTAYDFTSFPRQHYLDPEFLNTHRQQVFDEYRDLTETLMHEYSGSGRVFIIGHWEGDNQVYCGSSYDFQTADHKRDACIEQYPEVRLAGLTAWLKIRQEAIAEGRRRATAAGASNVEVYHAVEFNTIFASRRVSGASISSRDYKGVLDTSVPAVHPDVCSYSAWESVNRNRLTKDLQDIMKKCAPAPVIVGEIGDKDNPDKRYAKIVSTLLPLKESVPLVFFWQAFEPRVSKDPGFGLFNPDGTPLHAKAVEAIRRLQQ